MPPVPSTVEAKPTLQQFEADMTDMLNGTRKVAATEFMDHFIDYRNLVKSSEDPDVKLKFLRFAYEMGWPAVKAKDQAQQLPVFNISIDLSSNAPSMTIDVQATEALDGFEEQMRAFNIPPHLVTAVNVDINDEI